MPQEIRVVKVGDATLTQAPDVWAYRPDRAKGIQLLSLPPPEEALQGPDVFFVGQTATGDYAVLTDRVAITFPRGMSEDDHRGVVHEFGLTWSYASSVMPHRVVASVPGDAWNRACVAAEALRASGKVVSAVPDIIFVAKRARVLEAHAVYTALGRKNPPPEGVASCR